MKIKLKNYFDIEKGSTGIQSAIPGDFPLVVTAEERLTSNNYQFDCNAVCVPMVSSSGHGKATLNRIHYQTGKFALGNILCALVSKNEEVIMTKYLYIFLSINKDKILVPLMKGSANVALSLKSLKELEIDIPNIDVQKRIVREFEEFDFKHLSLVLNLKQTRILVDNLYSSIFASYLEKCESKTITDMFLVEKGSLQSSKAIEGEFNFITASEEWKTSNCYDHDGEALIFAMGASGSLGRTHYVNGKYIASDLTFILTSRDKDIDLNFYYYLFNYLREKIVKDLSTGSAKKAINAKNFKSYRLPYLKKKKSDEILGKLIKLFSLKKQIDTLQSTLERLSASYIESLF